MPLDRTIQELESRLPDLRHLIAEGEIVLATSESAALLADELEFLLGRADTVASRLRQLLLGGNLTGLAEGEMPVPATPVLESAASAPTLEPPAAAPPVMPSSAPAAWSEMDDELARIMGIAVGASDDREDVEQGGQTLEELRRKQKLPLTSSVPRGMIAAERELEALEQNLGIDASPEGRRAHLQELEALARHFTGDQEKIKDLWREMGIDLDTPDEPSVGATVDTPGELSPPPHEPDTERPSAEAGQVPRNP